MRFIGGGAASDLQLVHVSATTAAASAAAATAAATAAVGPGPGPALQRARARFPGPGGAGVRVHVVAGYDVDADVAGRAADAVARPPRECHRGLAAAVMEQIDVRVPEVPVPGAVDQVVKARLAERQPRQIVEHLGGQLLDGGQGQDHGEWCPEHDEHNEAVRVGQHQRVVPVERQRRLEARVQPGYVHLVRDPQVQSSRDEQRRQHDGCGHQSLGRHDTADL